MRVLFVNNYDMRAARAGWRAGRHPSHHLFGTAQLGDEFELVDVPTPTCVLSQGLAGRLRPRLGDLGQQLATVRRLRRDTVIYGAHGADLRTLGLLRSLGLMRAPIVGVIHGEAELGRLDRACLAGFDRVVAMSEHTRRVLIAHGLSPHRIDVLGWGPDLAFPGFVAAQRDADAGVVSTGKSGRDLPLLLRALAAEGLTGRIFGERDHLERVVGIPDAVKIVPTIAPTGSSTGYGHVLDSLRRAAVVAVPLSERYPLHGLTEIADAIACAKPVIVTRAPYFDFDIERIGCGWWVEPDDLDGLRRALRAAMTDRARLAAMGERGRQWASEHWNEALFSEGVRRILRDVSRTG